MSNLWIINVLNDLEVFANANDLERLANRLREVSDIARHDIIENQSQRCARVNADGTLDGFHMDLAGE